MANAGYTTPARILHWGMAVLILATIPAGFVMVQQGIPRGLQDALFIYHKNVGVLLLGLVLVRLAWRRRHPPPPLPAHLQPLQARMAQLTHGALYVLLLVLPVAGYVRVRAGGFPVEALDAMGLPALVPRSDALAEAAKALHFGAAIAIAVVLAMHIGAALLHAVILRDGVFQRMWPPRPR